MGIMFSLRIHCPRNLSDDCRKISIDKHLQLCNNITVYLKHRNQKLNLLPQLTGLEVLWQLKVQDFAFAQ